MGNNVDPDTFDASIDITQLDKACLDQPMLVFRWNRALADATIALGLAKQALAVEIAENSREIRSNPVDFGLAKATDASVELALNEQPIIKKLQKKVIEAKHNADVLGAAVAALEHRKRAIGNLIDLYSMEYSSMPVVKGAARAKFEEMSKGGVRRRSQRTDDDE